RVRRVAVRAGALRRRRPRRRRSRPRRRLAGGRLARLARAVLVRARRRRGRARRAARRTDGATARARGARGRRAGRHPARHAALPPRGLYAASLGLSLVVGNWVVELLHRNAGVAKGTAGAVGALTLLLGVVTRPLGGWILRERPASTRGAVGASLVAGAAGTALLAVAEPLALAVVGAVLIGLAAGIPFAPAFTGAALARPDAPAAAVGLVNGAASLVAICGAPLLGLTFSLPGDGRIGFAVVAALWLVALALLPSRHDLAVRAA